MLEIIKDKLGNIKAACEWRKVNNQGQNDVNGKNIWIHEIEISKPYRNNGIIKELIKRISDEMPNFEYCYFSRYRRNAKIRCYSKKTWLNRIRSVK
jgi:hypothetical protein